MVLTPYRLSAWRSSFTALSSEHFLASVGPSRKSPIAKCATLRIGSSKDWQCSSDHQPLAIELAFAAVTKRTAVDRHH